MECLCEEVSENCRVKGERRVGAWAVSVKKNRGDSIPVDSRFYKEWPSVSGNASNNPEAGISRKFFGAGQGLVARALEAEQDISGRSGSLRELATIVVGTGDRDSSNPSLQ